jgi:holo-[acyl-carrier protein] synthase
VLVGTDVESIDEVAQSLIRFGDRYARRLFTAHEIESCGGVCMAAAPGLAARFAAKEATLKLLRPTVTVPGWRSIEVRRQDGGWVELKLTGEAADLARATGLQEFAVSLSHGAGVGMATVVATRWLATTNPSTATG